MGIRSKSIKLTSLRRSDLIKQGKLFSKKLSELLLVCFLVGFVFKKEMGKKYPLVKNQPKEIPAPKIPT